MNSHTLRESERGAHVYSFTYQSMTIAPVVRAGRRVSQAGESAGLALVMLTKGRHFRGSRTPWHQSPQSPRQTGSIWALSAPLAPTDSDLYDGEWRSGLDQGEGKYETLCQILQPCAKCMPIRNYVLNVCCVPLIEV